MPRNNPWADVPVAPADLDIVELATGREVELDVGFGRAHFLLDRAAMRPDTLLIGLEMRRKWVGLARQRAERRGLPNVIAWYGDVRYLLPTWVPDASLAAIFVNFPDPWWKKKHQKRLVMNPDTLGHMARLLRPGGLLFVQTDVEERAIAYRPMLEEQPMLENIPPEQWPHPGENPIGVASHREKKCAEAGLPVYRFLYRKRAPSAMG